MEASTITTRTLEIEGMTGAVCVQKVTDALKNVHGVSTQSVKVGSATIGADQAGTAAATAAINAAGFKARERAGAAQTNDSTYAAAQSTTEVKVGGQCGSSMNAASSACGTGESKGSCSSASEKPVAAGV